MYFSVFVSAGEYMLIIYTLCAFTLNSSVMSVRRMWLRTLIRYIRCPEGNGSHIHSHTSLTHLFTRTHSSSTPVSAVSRDSLGPNSGVLLMTELH